MANGKYQTRRAHTSSRKLIALLIAMILLLCGAIGGTMAWLLDETDQVVNTFTYGDVNIKLEETDTGLDDDNDSNTNDYKMIPGADITKDPVVTVEKDNEDVWLFVKLEKSSNFDTFLTFTKGAGWEELKTEGDTVILYSLMEADTDGDPAELHVLEGDRVTVKSDVTKEMLNALDEGDTDNYPTLKVTAYAMQYQGFEAETTDAEGNPIDLTVAEAIAAGLTAEHVADAANAAWEAAVAQINSTANP